MSLVGKEAMEIPVASLVNGISPYWKTVKSKQSIFGLWLIEVIPFMPYQKGTKGFIDIKYDKNYCHVYFNDDTEEIKWNYFTSGDNVQKIKIVLDYRIQSLNGIFSEFY